MVTDEIDKVKKYNCDCTYDDWSENWGKCSVTCGPGTKEETRQIKWNVRNDGKNCSIANAKRTKNCNDGGCPVDCVWDEWSEWSACPEILTSKQQYEYAYRSILTEHEYSGQSCEGKTKKSRKCNILSIKNEIIGEQEDTIQSLKDEINGLKEGCGVTTTTSSTTTTTTTTTATTTEGNCVTTSGFPGAGSSCVFPFTIDGKTYNGCTTYFDPENKPWCSTKVDSNGGYITGYWGHCNSACKTDQGTV